MEAKGLVLFGSFGQKNRSEAEPDAARPGDQKEKKRLSEDPLFNNFSRLLF